MGYLISASAGLAVGLGFLIWALCERSARSKAEGAAAESLRGKQQAERNELEARTALGTVELDLTRARVQLEVLRRTIKEAQDRLLQCNEPKAVFAWLDRELGESWKENR